jgi:hypothetical protein
MPVLPYAVESSTQRHAPDCVALAGKRVARFETRVSVVASAACEPMAGTGGRGRLRHGGTVCDAGALQSLRRS